jgi:thiaminase/transcriptional activator TenA
MSERFTEILRAASEPAWSDAVRHRFVKELFAGAVPDAVMARYLVQDHRFLDSFLTLLGAALASADTFEARLRFGRFIGMVSGEENTYFLRAFEVLGVTEDRRAADPDTQPTAGFKAIMREAAETLSYAAALSVLVVAEWLYLDWAARRAEAATGQFRARRVDHASRQSGFSRLRRFPARGVGPNWPRAGGSLPRLFPSRCRPRTLLLRNRLRRRDLTGHFRAPEGLRRRVPHSTAANREGCRGRQRWTTIFETASCRLCDGSHSWKRIHPFAGTEGSNPVPSSRESLRT